MTLQPLQFDEFDTNLFAIPFSQYCIIKPFIKIKYGHNYRSDIGNLYGYKLLFPR